MNKSTVLYIMAAIYVAPHVSESLSLILGVCFLVNALIFSWLESKEKSE